GGEFPVILVDDRPGPGKFRLAGRVENAPIGPDAAFKELPGLIDRLHDVVFHADGFGAGDEVAQHHGLLEPAGNGIFQIITGAWPAEFGDHDPLAGKLVAQQLEHRDRLVHRLLVGEVFPVWQHVRGNEVDGVTELRIVAPDVPDLAGRDRHPAVERCLDPPDQLDQVIDLLLAAKHGLVADHDADDIAVALGKIDGRGDLALVAGDVLVDPGAERTLDAEFGGYRRHQFNATGRGIKPDRPRQRRQLFHV